ncbi:MAG: hypothetical protein NT159_24850 [Proteobacteria bacterium]|nr:hypothetical protein [Pseudomonadota bacterium]
MKAIQAVLAIFSIVAMVGCGAKGMDHVITLKQLDKLETVAGEMNADDELLFRQTVMAEVGRLTMQIGLSAMTEGLGGAGDPSRDKTSTQFDEAFAKLQALEGKTARAATLEMLQGLKATLQLEHTKAKAQAAGNAELARQVQGVKFAVQKVEIERKDVSGRAADFLSVTAKIAAPNAPAVFIHGVQIHFKGNDGKDLRPPIAAETHLALPCSACEVYLGSFADPAEGYLALPKKPEAIEIEIDKWAARNPGSQPSVDIADLQERIATLDRKITSITQTK